jgi:AI-2 transport protein TqsA
MTEEKAAASEPAGPLARVRTLPSPFLYGLVGLASIFVIIWGIQNLAAILNPILLAMVITITLLPLPNRLMKRGLSSGASVLVTILVVVGVVVLVGWLVFVSIGHLSADVPAYESRRAAAEVLPPAEVTGQPQVDAFLAQLQAAVDSRQAAQVLAKTIGALAPVVVQVFMAGLIFVFMLSAAIALPRTTRGRFDPANPVLVRVTQLTEDVRVYMSTMTLVNSLVGLGDAIFLAIVGVDYALLWGVLAFFLGYIPSIGFWVALIPPVALAYLEFGAPTALVVFVAYVLINGGVQNFVQPKLMGDRLRISPVVVFVSLFAWGFILGGIGAILAVPLTMLILAVLESFDGTRWVAILLRLAPKEKEKDEERAAAVDRMKGLWSRVRKLGG